jgi:hypothetical protein
MIASSAVTGLLIGKLVFGGTNSPTIDNTGVSQFSWLNGTGISVNYIYLGSLTTDPISPSVGEMWYNSVSGQFKAYNGTTIALGGGAQVPAGPAGSGMSNLPFNALVFQNSTSNYMIDGTTGSVNWSSSSASGVLNAAIGNLTNGGMVFVKSPMSVTDGNVVITHSFVTLTSGLLCDNSASSAVTINDLIINASSNAIYGVKIDGLYIKDLTLHSKGHEIRNTTIQNCFIQSDSTHHGITTIGDGTINGWQDTILYESCTIVDLDQEGLTYGVVNFQYCQFITNYHFSHCSFSGYASNETFFFVRGDADVDSSTADHCQFYMDTGTYNNAVFFVQGATENTYPATFGFEMTSCRIEIHIPVDLLRCTDSSYTNTVMNFEMHDMSTMYGTPMTLFNDSNTHWSIRKITMENNYLSTSNPLIFGTLQSTIPCYTKITRNHPYNPVGKITTPVIAATGELSPWGNGAIANNTIYRCMGVPLDLYLSGGTFNSATSNCTLDGQAIFSNLATGPTICVHLEVNSTILFGWTSAPTIACEGE